MGHAPQTAAAGHDMLLLCRLRLSQSSAAFLDRPAPEDQGGFCRCGRGVRRAQPYQLHGGKVRGGGPWGPLVLHDSCSIPSLKYAARSSSVGISMTMGGTGSKPWWSKQRTRTMAVCTGAASRNGMICAKRCGHGCWRLILTLHGSAARQSTSTQKANWLECNALRASSGLNIQWVTHGRSR